jgi:4-amino-4-deoxy-L-arabinose transferase-like glycosyltransferase
MVFLIPLAAVSYKTARGIGADKTASTLSALGLMTIPIMLVPAFDAVSDVPGVAFLGVSIYFALFRPTGTLRDLAVAGLAAGLAFGFKSLHLIGIGYLAVIVGVRAWHSGHLRGITQATAVFVCATLRRPGSGSFGTKWNWGTPFTRLLSR